MATKCIRCERPLRYTDEFGWVVSVADEFLSQGLRFCAIGSYFSSHYEPEKIHIPSGMGGQIFLKFISFGLEY